MSDLISRQAAIDALHIRFRDGFEEDKWWNSTHVLAALEGVPSAQPEHGRWKPFDLTWGRSIYYCTSCGDGCEVPTEMEKPIYDYCPNCGAKMDGEEE